MKTKAYRILDKLNTNFRNKVELFIGEINKNEEIIFITESWRSEERQKELIKLKLSYVTRSNHQDGLAIDIGFRGNELYPKDETKWRKVADIAKKYGIDWGFDLWEWDKPHFQDNGLPLKTTLPTMKKSKYSDILTQELKTSGLNPLLKSYEGDKPITEQEIKELLEIIGLRIRQEMIAYLKSNKK